MKTITTRPMTFALAADQRPGTAVDISSVLPGYPWQAAPEFESDIFIAPRRSPLSATRRLVVLIPEGDLDDNVLARKIWQLASGAALQVHLLSVSPDEEQASIIRRRLSLLSASLHQCQVRADTSFVLGNNWDLAVRKVLHGGDLLVCIAQHKVTYHALLHRTLGESLAVAFDKPVYMLGGLNVGWSSAQLQRVRSIAAWTLSLIILVGFAGVQIWMSQNASPQLSSILICLSILAEAITLFKVFEWIG